MSNTVTDYWDYLDSLNERTRSAVRTTKSASMIADMQSMLSEVMSSNATLADKSLAIGVVLLAFADEMSKSTRFATGFVVVKSGLHFGQAYNKLMLVRSEEIDTGIFSPMA